MKLAITSSGNSLDDPMDERFGRAPYFIILDLDNSSYTSINNVQDTDSAQGAGIQAAQNIVNTGADVVITGNIGPKAFTTLKAAEVDIYITGGITVNEAISKYKKGLLEKAAANNVEGHW